MPGHQATPNGRSRAAGYVRVSQERNVDRHGLDAQQADGATRSEGLKLPPCKALLLEPSECPCYYATWLVAECAARPLEFDRWPYAPSSTSQEAQECDWCWIT